MVLAPWVRGIMSPRAGGCAHAGGVEVRSAHPPPWDTAQARFGPLLGPSQTWPCLHRGPDHGHRGTSRDILSGMLAVKAHVEQGRLKLDEPTNLPEGEIVELVPLDEVLANGGDCLDDEEREALHAALDEAEADIAAGRVVSEDEVWARLRAIK